MEDKNKDLIDDLKKNASVSGVPNVLPKGSIMLGDRQQGLPDLAKLTQQIIEFIEYIEMPAIKEMEKENKIIFKQHIENKFEDFTLDYYSTYKMLMDDPQNRAKNLEKLFNFINVAKNIEKGQTTVEQEFTKIREKLAEEYLYPQFGGKMAFQKAFEKDQKKKNKKKK